MASYRGVGSTVVVSHISEVVVSRRAVKWIASLGAIEALVLALTIHSAVTYRPGVGSPSVMPLGQLLGWIVSAVLLLLILVITKESRR